MADVAQMTVDAAYSELRKLSSAGHAELAALDAQKLRLQNAYSVARGHNDTATMKALDPLIHRNSQLRLDYKAFVTKFNSIVNGIGGLLKKAGLSVPTLSGVGILPSIVVPAVWAIGIVVAWDLLRRFAEHRKAVDADITALLRIADDPNRSPADRAAALAAARDRMKGAGDNPLGIDLGKLMPLGLIALAIMVGPQLVSSFAPRRATTNPRRRRRRRVAA